MLTAITAVFLLPMTGCSSQQQGEQGEEVAAQGQEAEQGAEQGAAQGEEVASAQGEEPAAQAAEQGAPANEAVANNGEPVVNEMAEAGANVPADQIAVNAEPGTDAAAIITEMNATAPVETVAAAPEAAAPEAAAPEAAAPPPATVSVAGVPEEGSKMPYVVEVGDTLSKIATKIHGDQKRWRDIASLSGITNPNHIFPGDLVYYTLEASSQSFASSYEGVRRGKETVQSGDTLASIARRVYGSSSLWRHIWRQNDTIENPDQLTAGTAVYYVEKGSVKSAESKSKSNHYVKTVKVLKTVKTIKTANQTPTNHHVQKLVSNNVMSYTLTLN